MGASPPSPLAGIYEEYMKKKGSVGREGASELKEVTVKNTLKDAWHTVGAR